MLQCVRLIVAGIQRAVAQVDQTLRCLPAVGVLGQLGSNPMPPDRSVAIGHGWLLRPLGMPQWLDAPALHLLLPVLKFLVLLRSERFTWFR